MIRFLKLYQTVGISFLLIALLLQSFPKSLVVMDYYLNTDAFAAYCINKDKPQMHCNGKCRMERMMKNMGRMNSTKKTPRTTHQTLISVYLPPEVIWIEVFKNLTTRLNCPFYRPNLHLHHWANTIFKPPQFFS